MLKVRPWFLRIFLMVVLICFTAIEAQAQTPQKIFNVTQSPYNADSTGVNPAGAAINSAVTDAISWGKANSNGLVEVFLPAGKYNLSDSRINVSGATNLILSGDTSADTFLTITRTQNFAVELNYGTNVTLQNFSEDANQIAFTQGTIQSINRSTNTVTVTIESGYPSLNDPFFAVNAPGADDVFFTYSMLPERTNYDVYGGQPNIKNIVQTSPTVWTLTLDKILPFMFVGEPWLKVGEVISDGAAIINTDYNPGAITVQNVHMYGGLYGWGLNAIADDGPVTVTNVTTGPPPYQSDRLMDLQESMDTNGGNRGAFTLTNCNFSDSWDDCIDFGENNVFIKSQTDATHIMLYGSPCNDYKTGDTLDFQNFTNAPTGTIYATAQVAAATYDSSSGGFDLTLTNTKMANGGAFTIENPGNGGGYGLGNFDVMDDVDQTSPITLTNSTFSSESGRVLLHTAKAVNVTGCTFHDFLLPGLEIGSGGEDDGPYWFNNVTIKNNTFTDCEGTAISAGNAMPGGGYTSDAASTNVDIEGNTFLNSGISPYYVNAPVPISAGTITGLTVKGNTFENAWGTNLYVGYSQNVTITGNAFNHPNERYSAAGATVPDPKSVVDFSDCSNVTLNGNIVSSAGPYTNQLVELLQPCTGVTGQANGVIDIDAPLAFVAM